MLMHVFLLEKSCSMACWVVNENVLLSCCDIKHFWFGYCKMQLSRDIIKFVENLNNKCIVGMGEHKANHHWVEGWHSITLFW